MNVKTDSLKKVVNQIGFWSAVFTTVWTVWFIVAFGYYMSSLPLEWPGIDAFVNSFDPIPYILWVIPCLLLTLTFPIMMSCIHYYVIDDKKIWSLIGLTFAIMYGAVLSTNYWVLMTVVRESIMSGQTEGLEWFIVGSPHSITNSIEGIGYGFMGLATFFSGQIFNGDKLNNWIRWTFTINGLAGIIGVFLGGLGFIVATIISLIIWCITFLAGSIMVAILFNRSKNAVI